MALGKRDDSQPSARINPADAHTILGKDARFSGKMSFEGAVRIDGKFEGEIYTEDLLLIGPQAEVRATLNVGTVVINGLVEGDVIAKGSVELKAPGKLRGNVVTPNLIIEKGVTFDGTCRMSEEVSTLPRKSIPPPPPTA
ncbi:MAG: polymer-forming cytoskeletal protein [Deltaproteobacteria bacterium]|jgi:cytoskeletal protein CcmA (bactofilin family)|nr:polymer-forming cytoskeletal protein [Deltaproteobacteria bacterium]